MHCNFRQVRFLQVPIGQITVSTLVTVRDWEQQQALPIGNGYMGGMIFGLLTREQIQINEETFWAAGLQRNSNRG